MENINLFDEENNSLNEPPENSPAKGEKRKGKIKWPIFLNGSSLLIIYALFIVLPILIRGMNLVIINPGKVGIAYNKRGKTEFRCVTYPDPLSPIFSFIRCSAQPTKKRFFFDIKHKRNTGKTNFDQNHLQSHHYFVFRCSQIKKYCITSLRKICFTTIAVKNSTFPILSYVSRLADYIIIVQLAVMLTVFVWARLPPIFRFSHGKSSMDSPYKE